MVADCHARRDHRVRADVARVPDADSRPFVFGRTACQRPLHGVVRVDVHAGADRARRSDLESARSVEYRERPDPRVRADADVAVDVTRGVDARAGAESELAGTLPAVGEELVERQRPLPALPYLRVEAAVQLAQIVGAHARSGGGKAGTSALWSGSVEPTPLMPAPAPAKPPPPLSGAAPLCLGHESGTT